ncbi:MAG: potassium channel family protein [Myxococcota bacterium]|nr:potassium channel family protein [Myxococcota bacterium]
MADNLRIRRERGPFSGLLVALLFFIFVSPFVSDEGAGKVFLYLSIFSILIANTYVSASSRELTFLSIAVLIVAAMAWLGPDFLPHRLDDVLRYSIIGLGTGFTAVLIVQSVLRHETVTLDTILGGINAYLLIAIAFTFGHGVIAIIEPDAYTLGDVPIGTAVGVGADAYATMLYFSLVTMTTLGYGDMAPIHPLARLFSGAESVLGQLFVAIFIARLVSLEVSQRTRGPVTERSKDAH